MTLFLLQNFLSPGHKKRRKAPVSGRFAESRLQRIVRVRRFMGRSVPHMSAAGPLQGKNSCRLLRCVNRHARLSQARLTNVILNPVNLADNRPWQAGTAFAATESTDWKFIIMKDAIASRRWLVVVGAILIQLALGAIYAWSVFTKLLTDPEGVYRFSATETAWIFSAGLATFARGHGAGGPLAGAHRAAADVGAGRPAAGPGLRARRAVRQHSSGPSFCSSASSRAPASAWPTWCRSRWA
jgi:hypothetical protein